jgi:hypothetical protein
LLFQTYSKYGTIVFKAARFQNTENLEKFKLIQKYEKNIQENR